MRITMWRLVFIAATLCVGTGAALAESPQPSASNQLAQILRPGPATQPGQSATLLPDGTWLLLGGKDAQAAPSASALVVDPRSRTTRQLPAQLSQGRAGHSATMLPDGTVLILGGVLGSGAIAATAERFDPASGAVSSVPALGLISRTQHTATLLSDGRLLIAGGVDARGNPIYDVELYNTITNQIESFNARLDHARLNDLAGLLPSGTVLLWGGVSGNGTPLPGAELYDPTRAAFLPFSAETARTLASALVGPVPPVVLGSDPADGDVGADVAKNFSLRFSKRLDVTTVNAQTIVLVGPAGSVDLAVTPVENGVLAFAAPIRQLLPNSHYTLFVNGAKDALGQEVPFTAIGFKTAALVPTGQAAASESTSTSPNPAAASGQPVKAQSPSTGDPSQQKKPAPATLDADEWIPTDANFKGDWRTGRARERAQITLPRRAEVLRAIHGIGGNAATSSVPAGVTAVAGQVLLLNGKALPNVTLSIGSRAARTDSNGEFLLTDVPAGSQTLVIDGGTASEANRRYGRYEYHMNVASGKLSALPFVIWMTRIDTAHAAQIASPTTAETVITTPRIPGLELRIPSGKVIRDAAGKIVTEITITAIPVDQPPFPLPNVPVPVYFTIQPGGAHLEDVAGTGSIGARLIYPNFSNGPPGSRMDFWNYDSHDRGWYVYGQGSVSADGRQTIPDPGVAIYEFTGAMIGGPGNAPPKGPPAGGCHRGDPVDCYTGLFVHKRVDLRVNDVIPIEVARTYRPGDSAIRSFGIGTMFDYDIFLVGDYYTYQELILPDGGRIHYTRTSPGTAFGDAVYQHTATPTEFYGSTLFWDGVGWTLQLKNGTKYKFNDSFQTTNFRKSAPYQITDRFGNTINLVRDANGNVTQIVSPSGRTISLTSDASNRITQAQDDLGHTVTYQYDTSGRLSSVTDPASNVEQYTYDTSHRMLTVRDKRNNVMVTNTYDTNGRVSTQTYADNTTNTFAYTLDGSGNVTQTDITDERNVVTRMAFNSSGYPVTITKALGQTEQQVIQNELQAGTNLLLSQTDAYGRKTAYQYDAKGNVTSMTLLDGTANAVSWTYTYEPTYNQLATVTDPLNHTTTYQYDGSGNLASITDALNNVTQLAYNAAGQVTSVTDPLNHATSLGYAGGDLVSITDPLGRSVSLATDVLGRVTAVTDPLGNRTTTAYDALSRITSRTDALGQQVSFGYDPNGNLTSFIDARTNVTSFAYDVRNRVITKTDALTQAESYQYDAAGNLAFVTDRKGQVRGFTYDKLGRKTQAGFGATSTTSPVYDSTIAYTYDAANRVTQMVDSANGTISRQYDDRFDTITEETTPQGTMDYVYDAAGRRSSMTPGNSGTQVSYTYDAANRLTQITQGSSTVQFSYDAANRRSVLTLANGVTLTYGYDVVNQLTSITYRDSSSTLLGDLTYAYDNAGRRTGMGGSFARTNLPAAIASATYDVNNRVSNWNGSTLAHDANGNLLGFQGDAYTWNKRDQLSTISGTNSASFQYDAVGRRQAKTISGAATQFLYDGLNPIQELAGGSVAASLLTGLGVDEFFARTEGSSTQHYLTDALASTLRLTNNSAAKIVDYTYEPYGKASADASSTNAFQYTGRENDGTGLSYYRARYQHPVLGRFIAEDPIGLAGGPDLYAYVNSNPTNFTDPEGLILTALHALQADDGSAGTPGWSALDQAVQAGQMGNTAMASGLATAGIGGTALATGAAAPEAISAAWSAAASSTGRAVIAASLSGLARMEGVGKTLPSLANSAPASQASVVNAAARAAARASQGAKQIPRINRPTIPRSSAAIVTIVNPCPD